MMVTSEEMPRSDHSTLVMGASKRGGDGRRYKRRKNFTFEEFCYDVEGCEQVVEVTWEVGVS